MSGVAWPLATSIGVRFAGTHPLEDTYHTSALGEELPALLHRAKFLVESETGLTTYGDPTTVVVSRTEWVERNVDVFARLLKPAEEKLGSDDSIFGPKVLATEMGAVLGFFARRVLGQYELVMPRSDEGDVIALVGANVLSLERQYQFRPSEFRFWIALHECTHRAQFIGVPWMRDYFLGLVDELVASAVPEKGGLLRVFEQIRAAQAEGRDVIGERGAIGLLATETQREHLDKVQALMSLLEGHGHVVMDRIGERELTSQGRMSAVLKQRRADPKTQGFLRLTGLEMKMRQYEMGERFIKGVERAASWDVIDRAWTSPQHLPTLSEIKDPKRWLERIA